MKKIKNLSKGFTLIELLIVIAIIGVLSTLLMANFIGVRQRARDAQRKSDIRQIQAALEIYRSDNGAYPATGSFPSPCGGPLASGSSTYMQKIPCDPSGAAYWNSGNYYYQSNGVGNATYILGSCLENAADTQGKNLTDSGIAGAGTPPAAPGDTNCPAKWYFVVNNP